MEVVAFCSLQSCFEVFVVAGLPVALSGFLCVWLQHFRTLPRRWLKVLVQFVPVPFLRTLPRRWLKKGLELLVMVWPVVRSCGVLCLL